MINQEGETQGPSKSPMFLNQQVCVVWLVDAENTGGEASLQGKIDLGGKMVGLYV